MDRSTLLAHRAHRTKEYAPVRHDLACLTPAESELYVDLCQDRLPLVCIRNRSGSVMAGWSRPSGRSRAGPLLQLARLNPDLDRARTLDDRTLYHLPALRTQLYPE
ncbi:hypothetical protein GWK36_06370 [Caldichromatium japonicum]|uniref:Uncharacterized protein n=1 Tax=Caldichromatium japonicum TaxID=2699430 RepID=A0A6G7VC85_9GAMM|nr:hypothetical protein GWK36_06370 [Caldichromatium japonicum]